MYLFFQTVYITVYILYDKDINKFKWQFIPFKACDMYTASSAEVSVCIRGPSGATYEYKSPNFNEIFAVYKFINCINAQIAMCNIHMNISCIFYG